MESYTSPPTKEKHKHTCTRMRKRSCASALAPQGNWTYPLGRMCAGPGFLRRVSGHRVPARQSVLRGLLLVQVRACCVVRSRSRRLKKENAFLCMGSLVPAAQLQVCVADVLTLKQPNQTHKTITHATHNHISQFVSCLLLFFLLAILARWHLLCWFVCFSKREIISFDRKIQSIKPFADLRGSPRFCCGRSPNSKALASPRSAASDPASSVERRRSVLNMQRVCVFVSRAWRH